MAAEVTSPAAKVSDGWPDAAKDEMATADLARLFHRKLLCMQDPRKPNVRDLAIAQGAFTLYGDDDPTQAVLRWLEPLSPILGWNGGDEFKTTRLTSEQGHIQTATDWCTNLPVLMAGSEDAMIRRPRSYNPRAIDWNDQRSTIRFVSSDGDNVQWLQGDFFRNRSYWRNPQRGQLPFGWSCCFAHLAQLAPELIDQAATTQSRHDSFVEWGARLLLPDVRRSALPRGATAARHWLDREGAGESLQRHLFHDWSLQPVPSAWLYL